MLLPRGKDGLDGWIEWLGVLPAGGLFFRLQVAHPLQALVLVEMFKGCRNLGYVI
jgi:hypothetical protein